MRDYQISIFIVLRRIRLYTKDQLLQCVMLLNQ